MFLDRKSRMLTTQEQFTTVTWKFLFSIYSADYYCFFSKALLVEIMACLPEGIRDGKLACVIAITQGSDYSSIVVPLHLRFLRTMRQRSIRRPHSARVKKHKMKPKMHRRVSKSILFLVRFTCI